MKLEDGDLYKEAQEHYRFLLNWRNATVAAIIIVVYFGVDLFVRTLESSIEISVLILIGMIILILFFWIVDIRTRDLFRTALEVGKLLEDKANLIGVNNGYLNVPSRRKPWQKMKYDFPQDKKTKNRNVKKGRWDGFSHGFAIDLLCGLTLVMIVTLGFLVLK